jgi:hypothetical protein
MDRGSPGFDRWVTDEEEDGGSGTVFDGVVAPEVLEVDRGLYEMCQSSGMMHV